MRDKLVLDVDRRVSLQGYLLALASHLRSLFVQLLLKTGEYLDVLALVGGSSLMSIAPALGVVDGEGSPNLASLMRTSGCDE